jgi:hypothetical protein
VEIGSPSVDATTLVPPSASMICEAVMAPMLRKSQHKSTANLANCVMDARDAFVQPARVLDSRQLLARLAERGVKNADIARTLKIDPARVTEMRKGQRRLLLDEAVRLVQTFGLESDQVAPIHPAIPQLIARHIVRTLGLELEPQDPRLQELVADLSAFSRFVRDPQVRESLEAAEAFFRAMDLRRGAGEAEGQPQTSLESR